MPTGNQVIYVKQNWTLSSKVRYLCKYWASTMRYLCKIEHFMKETMQENHYPLYDVPYLVREPNGSYMSLARHKREKQNQAIVDDYFIERDKGTSAGWAQKLVARKHEIPILCVEYCLRWYYQEAVRRKKYDFLIKFPPAKEHIVQFWCIFAPDLKN